MFILVADCKAYRRAESRVFDGARRRRLVGRDSNDGAGDGNGAGDTSGNAEVHRAPRRCGESRHG